MKKENQRVNFLFPEAIGKDVSNRNRNKNSKFSSSEKYYIDYVIFEILRYLESQNDDLNIPNRCVQHYSGRQEKQFLREIKKNIDTDLFFIILDLDYDISPVNSKNGVSEKELKIKDLFLKYEEYLNKDNFFICLSGRQYETWLCMYSTMHTSESWKECIEKFFNSEYEKNEKWIVDHQQVLKYKLYDAFRNNQLAKGKKYSDSSEYIIQNYDNCLTPTYSIDSRKSRKSDHDVPAIIHDLSANIRVFSFFDEIIIRLFKQFIRYLPSEKIDYQIEFFNYESNNGKKNCKIENVYNQIEYILINKEEGLCFDINKRKFFNYDMNSTQSP